MQDQELRLARLRKLWLLAKSKGMVEWMKQIETDAAKIKTAPVDAYEVMKELVNKTDP